MVHDDGDGDGQCSGDDWSGATDGGEEEEGRGRGRGGRGHRLIDYVRDM